jgi:hypothetical protein
MPHLLSPNCHFRGYVKEQPSCIPKPEIRDPRPDIDDTDVPPPWPKLFTMSIKMKSVFTTPKG